MTGPLKLAIVGGGPSAFYVASRLLQLLPAARDLRIHIYDRLWAPHGLVRYGVAPDHPEVKNCTHKFDIAASDPRVRFFGNVHISATPTPYPPPPHTPHALSLALKTLFPYYTHLVLATGASVPRLHPALPRSGVCVPALDLVHWYTMHPSSPVPSYPSAPSISDSLPESLLDLHSPIPRGASHITLIGHGNVSLDIARLLLTPPLLLSPLDIPQHVLHALRDVWNTLRHVSIVGRRGPREAKFTAKEVREMMRLEEAVMVPIPENVLDDAERGDVYGGTHMTRQEVRILMLLRKGSGSTSAGARKTFSFEFWSNPTGYTTLPDRSAMLALEDTRFDPVTGRAVGTGKTRIVRTDLVVTSLGYQGDLDVFADDGVSAMDKGERDMSEVDQGDIGASVVDGQEALAANGQGAQAPNGNSDTDSSNTQWYDTSLGHIRNTLGRVLTPHGRVVRNVYTVGWAARGARGILAGTLMDANELAGRVIGDWKGRGVGETLKKLGAGVGESEVEVLPWSDVAGGLDGAPEAVERSVKKGNVLGYGAWRRVDEEERRKGGESGKERDRMAWGEVKEFLRGTGS